MNPEQSPRPTLRETSIVIQAITDELSRMVNRLDDELFKGKQLNRDDRLMEHPVPEKSPSVSDILEETEENLKSVLDLVIKISQRVSEQF